MGDKREHELLRLAYIKCSFVLINLEALGDFYVPLCSFLANVSDHDWLFSDMFHGHLAEVQLVGEVDHGSAAHGADGHDELFTLSEHSQVVGVVLLRFGGEPDYVGDFHAGGHTGGHVVDVSGFAGGVGQRFGGFCQVLGLFAGLNLKQFRIWRNYFNATSYLIFVSKV